MRFVITQTYIGVTPEDWDRYMAKDADHNGSGCAIFLQRPGCKGVTMLSPFTLKAWSLPDWAGEVVKAKDHPIGKQRLTSLLQEAWAREQSLGTDRANYDVTASVLRELGAVIPARAVKADGEEAGSGRGGGKPCDPSRIAPVTGGKRLKIVKMLAKLDWVSIHELTSATGGSRGYISSHLNSLHKATGLGYELKGDAVRLLAPKGWRLIDPDLEDVLG